MGFAPVIVDAMSLFEFSACQDGWRKANGAEEEAEPPSWEEHLAMVRKVKGGAG
ncbi:hypothetical protein [Allorhizobium borbori]|uniref:Uncharacterized protein n=1 Tax=Allorhizobium borbori TaxID=485907 RepID=A0A7W6P0Y3_9HYPH|nr:hypothetical protein [Allorhizobium borbori]MBB4103013.1 hypothetical protein [Allorhizobium borbori]